VRTIYDRFPSRKVQLELVNRMFELGTYIENLNRNINLQNTINSSLPIILLRIQAIKSDEELVKKLIKKVSELECNFTIDERNNIYLTPHNDKIITPQISKTGSYEKNVSMFLERTLPNVGTFVLIGANFGYHAIQQAQVHLNLRIIAIEPHFKTYTLLKENCDLNYVQIELLNFAIASTNGKVTLYESEFNGGNNRIKPFLNSLNIGTVNSITIKDCLQDLKITPEVFLIDMQGYEIETIVSIFQLQQSKTICIFELDIDLEANSKIYYLNVIEKFPENIHFSLLDSLGNLLKLTRVRFIDEVLNSYNKDLMVVAQN
jgi:FkbM family methyltransferase